jgi:hypothetical protein
LGAATPLALGTKIHRARVISIRWDAAEGGYRVWFRVFNLRRGDEWSTVHTDPPLDVRSTRWIGQTVVMVTPDRPPRRVDDEVMLTLEPY